MSGSRVGDTRVLREVLGFLERFQDIPVAAWGISTGTITVFTGLYTLADPDWPSRVVLGVLAGVVFAAMALAVAYTLMKPSRSERILRAQRDYDKGCVAFEDKRYADAVSMFDSARRQDERYSYESKYGRVCLRLGRYENAVAAFTRAHQLAVVKSERSAARRNRGVAFFITNQLGSALNDFSEYLESNKKSSVILRHRALVHYHRGDFAKAEADARAAVQIAPTNSAPHSTLAIVLAAAGDTDGAHRSLEKAMHASPESPAAQYAAAQVYAALGEIDEAYNLLTVAVQVDSRFSPRAERDPLFDPLRADSARFESALEVVEWKFLGSLEDDA
ncbi:MAG: tetratricopeptide repeat protein [Coriobacteriia bacterium]|nr:tetratricopeptide repeat protein [Coriobacteriia bacterium]